MYWNHNSAYYPWIRKKLSGCSRILDVGCGDGSLVAYLNDGTREITGIDVDKGCIDKALSAYKTENTDFQLCSFEEYPADEQFDAIVFVASIHHMNMEQAILKARSLLVSGGKLLIVGLAKPSGLSDWILEVARVIPSRLVSYVHKMQTSEDLNIPVSYQLPEMNKVRRIVKKHLPEAVIRYGLHYRYLLEWTKESINH